VLLAFLRLSTRPGLFPHPLTAAEAVRLVELCFHHLRQSC